jgi:lipid-A-disaccharide synthase
LKLYFIAGEKSGDLHAGSVLQQLYTLSPKAEIRGIGGDKMQKAGMELFFHYRQIALMGFWEVFKNLLALRKIISNTKNDILEFQPDAIVLVDSAGFNLRMARFAKEHQIPVIYYISPKVWAWNTGRAWKLKKLVDKMLVIFPFEVEFFKKIDWQVEYVGNPSHEQLSSLKASPDFRLNNGLNELPIIALLPGSRLQEIRSSLHIFQQLESRFPNHQFVIAGISDHPKELYPAATSRLHMLTDQTYDLLLNAEAAVVISGTASLETAILNVPQVVVYRTSSISYFIGKRLIKVPYISLVNLLLGRELVKELIQDEFNVEMLSKQLLLIMEGGERREDILAGYQTIHSQLGTKKASLNSARLIFDYLREIKRL